MSAYEGAGQTSPIRTYAYEAYAYNDGYFSYLKYYDASSGHYVTSSLYSNAGNRYSFETIGYRDGVEKTYYRHVYYSDSLATLEYDERSTVSPTYAYYRQDVLTLYGSGIYDAYTTQYANIYGAYDSTEGGYYRVYGPGTYY